MSFFSFFKRPPSFHSTINGQLSIGTSFGKKALFVGKIPQSGGEFIHMWDSIIRVLTQKKFVPQSVLILGVAGGTAIKSIRKVYPTARITGIDIDPVIIDVAEKYFKLAEDGKTTIIIADAIEWIKDNPRSKRYDLVIVDLYLGALNPIGARTKSFLSAVKKQITANGIVIYNCDFQQENTEKYLSYKKLCEKEFKNIEEIFSYKLNRVLLLQN